MFEIAVEKVFRLTCSFPRGMGRPQGENKARLEAFEKDYEIEIKEATSHAFADPTKTDSNGD